LGEGFEESKKQWEKNPYDFRIKWTRDNGNRVPLLMSKQG